MSNWKLQQAGMWARIAIVDDRQTELCDGPYEQRKALTLMAAAPELLEALKRATEWLRSTSMLYDFEDEVKELEGEIRKAEGK